LSAPAIELRGVTIVGTGAILLREVSLAVPAGTGYVLLGKGEGPRELLRCFRGERSADAGSIALLGMDPRKARRRLKSRFGSELLLLEEPTAEEIARIPANTTFFAATERPEIVGGFDGRVGLLGRGRLVAEGSPRSLEERFRSIRYDNRLTETRTALGTELDEFEAVRVRVRGWGVEAVVSNFDQAAFERFARIDGVEDAIADAMTLPEIFEAVAGG
jgi:ABC-type multidrug transport system ATPase subunit